MGSFGSDPLQGLVYYRAADQSTSSRPSHKIKQTSKRLGATYQSVLEHLRHVSPRHHDPVNHEAAELLSRFKTRS